VSIQSSRLTSRSAMTSLGGQVKTGHLWTGQNRPFRMAAGTM
jgi:hypothetical protein